MFVQQLLLWKTNKYCILLGARDRSTELQTGRSRGRFPTVLLTQSFPPHYGPENGSTSKANEYQEYFLGR